MGLRKNVSASMWITHSYCVKRYELSLMSSNAPQQPFLSIFLCRKVNAGLMALTLMGLGASMTWKPSLRNVGRDVVTLGCTKATNEMTKSHWRDATLKMLYANTAAPSWKKPSLLIVMAYAMRRRGFEVDVAVADEQLTGGNGSRDRREREVCGGGGIGGGGIGGVGVGGEVGVGVGADEVGMCLLTVTATPVVAEAAAAAAAGLAANDVFVDDDSSFVSLPLLLAQCNATVASATTTRSVTTTVVVAQALRRGVARRGGAIEEMDDGSVAGAVRVCV